MKLYPSAFNEFVQRSGRIRTPASKDSYRYVIAGLQAAHPNLGVGRFTTRHLVEFCLAGDPAPNTIKHRRSVLRTVFTWLKASGVISDNPASELEYQVRAGRHEVRPGRWYEESAVVEVIRGCDDTFRGRRDRLVLMFGFMLGLRASTIAGLRWDQFAPDYSYADLIVKGSKPTRKGIPDQLRSELQDWALCAPESAVAVIPGLRHQGIGLREQSVLWDQPLGRSGIANIVREAGQRCGLVLSPHDMRRTYAAMLETKGVPVTDIQRMLDHSNVGTTSIYLEKNPSKNQALTAGFNIDLETR